MKRRAMRPTWNSRSGFTLIEGMLALVFLATVMGAIAAATFSFRDALTTSGIETFSGLNYAISPDTSTRSSANLLGAELLSVSTQARYVLATDRPLSQDSILATSKLSILTGVSTATMTNPEAMRRFLGDIAGMTFEGDGYSLVFIGPSSRIVGALVVSTKSAVAANGDLFVLYDVRLYGDYDAGFGLLYAYKFASNAEPDEFGPIQAVTNPVYTPSGTWSIVLPDPLVPDRSPGGEHFRRLSYEIVSPFTE